jgi:hypothetical protein
MHTTYCTQTHVCVHLSDRSSTRSEKQPLVQSRKVNLRASIRRTSRNTRVEYERMTKQPIPAILARLTLAYYHLERVTSFTPRDVREPSPYLDSVVETRIVIGRVRHEVAGADLTSDQKQTICSQVVRLRRERSVFKVEVFNGEEKRRRSRDGYLLAAMKELKQSGLDCASEFVEDLAKSA